MSGSILLCGPFFARDTVTVARDLVGCILWTECGGEITAGRIVETEAYLDERDPASHAARGPTDRNRVMFGPPGVAYVYLIYGMHHCLNLVTEEEGQAGAVLLRALEPQAGEPIMIRRRGLSGDHGEARHSAQDRRLCAGPGRLCRAMGVDLAWNGLPLGPGPHAANEAGSDPAAREVQHLTDGRVWVSSGVVPGVVAAAPRIGITRAVDRPWRFCDPRSSCLSRPVANGPNIGIR